MPLFRNVHSKGRLSVDDATAAHAAYDFVCLADAPAMDTPVAGHREAHGSVADELHQARRRG
jgi:hypothetical protein